MSATVRRDGSIDFSGFSPSMGKINDLIAHSTRELVLMHAKDALRAEAQMRIWELRKSCGVKQTLRIHLSNGTA